MSDRHQVTLPIAVPPPLKAWIDEQATERGMTRNAFVNLLLQRAKEWPDAERLRLLELRLTKLEAISTNNTKTEV